MKWILDPDGSCWHVFQHTAMVCGMAVPEKIVQTDDLLPGIVPVHSECVNAWLAAQEAAITVAESDAKLCRSEIKQLKADVMHLQGELNRRP